MTRREPPARFGGTPARWTLPAGSRLSRVHRARFAAGAFNPVPADVLWGGGRFDATARDPHGYLYAALDDGPAVAETLLRDVDPDDRGGRFLPKSTWTGRQASRLKTTVALDLIALRDGEELGAIGQDSWLTGCGPEDYPFTRDWARWLRRQVADAQGLVWLSKRDPGHPVFVLWEDRCPANALAPADGPLIGPCRFDEPEGHAWLKATLERYRVTVR